MKIRHSELPSSLEERDLLPMLIQEISPTVEMTTKDNALAIENSIWTIENKRVKNCYKYFHI